VLVAVLVVLVAVVAVLVLVAVVAVVAQGVGTVPQWRHETSEPDNLSR
jgi:predicted PurR-regulated permease PerM